MEKDGRILYTNDWASELLKKMTLDEQIAWLTDRLAEARSDSPEVMDLFEGLKRIIKDEIILRSCLCKCHTEKGLLKEKTPKLTYEIATEILRGWDWHWESCSYKFAWALQGNKECVSVNIDAYACFSFICQIYSEDLGKILKNALIAHINLHKYKWTWSWKTHDLDEWINLKIVPMDIRVVLANTRMRIGGERLIEAENLWSRVFETGARSKEAVHLVALYMEKIRRTEELAEKLVSRITPTNRRGDFNPDLEVTIFLGDVEWKLESEKVVCISVTFIRSSNPEKAAERGIIYPRVMEDMQAARHILLRDIENPPQIFFEAHEDDLLKNLIPNSFSFSERG